MVGLRRGHPVSRVLKNFKRVVPPTPVSYDATGAGNYGALTSPSWSHTLGANASAITTAIEIWSDSKAFTVSAEVGSTEMILLACITNFYAATGYNLSLYMFGLLSPPTGNQTVALTTSAGAYVAGNSLSYNNVSSFGDAVTDYANGTSASLSVSSASHQMVVNMFGGANVASGSFSSYSQTSRYSVAAASYSNEAFILGDAPGVSAVSFGATAPSGVSEWGGIAVPLIN